MERRTETGDCRFRRESNGEGSSDFVPPNARIATFDNDGTLWAEQPIYFQFAFVFDRVKAMPPNHPEWKTKEPFASLLKGWTEATWNPVTGCTKISAGCKNCYAERLARRLKAMGSHRYRNGFRVTLHEDAVDLPRKWKAPRRIFVNSMSDLFHPEVPLRFIQQVFRTMRECLQHTFQILTKRSDRVRHLGPKISWPNNVWMGVSVEDGCVLDRIDDLREVPAALRFFSCEPLIGSLADINLRKIHWVIVGGESGPRSREMNTEWVREILRACRKEKVPFFFKQWGGVRKNLTGRLLGGRTYDEMPQAA